MVYLEPRLTNESSLDLGLRYTIILVELMILDVYTGALELENNLRSSYLSEIRIKVLLILLDCSKLNNWSTQ